MRRLLRMIASLAIATMSCDGKNDNPAPEGKAVVSDAPAGRCEHGLTQAVCPKCNPALAPVFQAKGDWCGEHGFPESFCPICHPERNGEPLANAAPDKAPADGLIVRLANPEVARRVGLETIKAEARSGGAIVVSTARLAYDATKQARMNARATGVVRELRVDIGAAVRKGQPLIVLDSPAVGADRARLAAAKSGVDVAAANLVRAEQLRAEGITSEKEVLGSRQILRAAEGEYAALAAALSVVGAPAGGAGSYLLTAPIDGTVTQRTATIGTLVQPDQLLLEVVDTSSLWAELDIPEVDIGRVVLGQKASLTFDSLPERTFDGLIDFLSPAIDPHTRTVRARVALPNPEARLRAEMFGQAQVFVETDIPVVVVPRTAIQRADDVALAFVRKSASEFEARRVTLGATQGSSVQVTKGLVGGEEVVTTGSFLLKTETLKGSIGAGCCETD